MGPIISAANTPLGSNQASLPILSGVLYSWLLPMVAQRIDKQIVNFEVVEVSVAIPFQGVIHPMSAEDLRLLPEGQRSWKWYTIYALPGTVLNPDDIITYREKNYRVMGKSDYSEYGFLEYNCIKDYTGSDPTEGSS